MICSILDHWVFADKLEQAKDLFAANTAVIRRSPGHVARYVLQSKKDPLKWTTVTIWEDEKAVLAWDGNPEHIWDRFGHEPKIPHDTDYFRKYGKGYTSVHTRPAVGENFDVIQR
jgi:heme-degrading monooxygenase HmoA